MIRDEEGEANHAAMCALMYTTRGDCVSIHDLTEKLHSCCQSILILTQNGSPSSNQYFENMGILEAVKATRIVFVMSHCYEQLGGKSTSIDIEARIKSPHHSGRKHFSISVPDSRQ